MARLLCRRAAFHLPSKWLSFEWAAEFNFQEDILDNERSKRTAENNDFFDEEEDEEDDEEEDEEEDEEDNDGY